MAILGCQSEVLGGIGMVQARPAQAGIKDDQDLVARARPEDKNSVSRMLNLQMHRLTNFRKVSTNIGASL